jgi:hypothetical protein
MKLYCPIALLSPELLSGMIYKGNKYFVRQQLIGGTKYFLQSLEAVIIVTHYSDKGKALEHMQAIQKMAYCKLYDIEIETDLQSLHVAASQPENYRIFTTLLNSKTWQPPDGFSERIRKYLRYRNYFPTRTDEVAVSPFFEFGVLFLKIKWGGSEIRIPFHDLK